MKQAIDKIDKLLEEAAINLKIVKITEDNFKEYFPLYKKIYETQFKTKINLTDFKKWLKTSHMIILPISKNEGAFARCKLLKNDKYTDFFKVKQAIMLSDFAAYPNHKGYGTHLLRYIIERSKQKKLPIITVPWKDNLIPYYEHFGFKTYHPKDKKLPSVIMIRKAK
jgi:hypothetical protein